MLVELENIYRHGGVYRPKILGPKTQEFKFLAKFLLIEKFKMKRFSWSKPYKVNILNFHNLFTNSPRIFKLISKMLWHPKWTQPLFLQSSCFSTKKLMIFIYLFSSWKSFSNDYCFLERFFFSISFNFVFKNVSNEEQKDFFCFCFLSICLIWFQGVLLIGLSDLIGCSLEILWKEFMSCETVGFWRADFSNKSVSQSNEVM